MIKILSLTYAFISGSVLVGWWQWKRIICVMALDKRLENVLVTFYWLLFGSMIFGATAFLAMGDSDWEWSDHRWIFLYGLSLGLVLQTAVFAFIFTPILMHLKNWRGEFPKRVIITECCFVLPVILVLGFNLWLFTHMQNAILK